MKLAIKITMHTMVTKKTKGYIPNKEYVRIVDVNEESIHNLNKQQKQELIDREVKEFLNDYLTIQVEELT